MDTSPEYILMCEKATEIQEDWKPREGDWCVERKYLDIKSAAKFPRRFTVNILLTDLRGYGFITATGREEDVAFEQSESIWLPRQDQLQAMVCESAGKLIADFGLWYRTLLETATISENDKLFFNTSLEQLWLAFVMREKYGKTWDAVKREWVGVTLSSGAARCVQE